MSRWRLADHVVAIFLIKADEGSRDGCVAGDELTQLLAHPMQHLALDRLLGLAVSAIENFAKRLNTRLLTLCRLSISYDAAQLS